MAIKWQCTLQTAYNYVWDFSGCHAPKDKYIMQNAQWSVTHNQQNLEPLAAGFFKYAYHLTNHHALYDKSIIKV